LLVLIHFPDSVNSNFCRWYSGNKMKMLLFLVLLITLLSATATLPLEALNVRGHLLKSKTFLSPPISLRPGSISNKFYLDIDFPRGHLAIKSFDAEVVDEHGVPIPLHETYLHHWVAEPYFEAKDATAVAAQNLPDYILIRNSGVCKTTLGQYYGLAQRPGTPQLGCLIPTASRSATRRRHRRVRGEVAVQHSRH
jgi:hypothetical protein